MLMIKVLTIRYVLISIYLIFFLFILSKPLLAKDLYTTVGKNGHLVWEWMNVKKNTLDYSHLFILFYAFTLFFIENVLLKWFIAVSLLFSIFFYYRDRTFASMWCWYVNVFLLYFIINILLVQPFIEYNGLC